MKLKTHIQTKYGSEGVVLKSRTPKVSSVFIISDPKIKFFIHQLWALKLSDPFLGDT